MANNVNINAARTVLASLMHITNNDYRYTNVGAIGALRSPQNAQIIAEADPRNAQDQNRLVIYKNGTITPTVTINYAPAKAVGHSTVRQKLEGGSLNGNSTIGNNSSSEIVYDSYIETVVSGEHLKSDIFKEQAAIEYINKILSGKVSVSGTVAAGAGSEAKGLLTTMGLEIAKRADADMLRPINTVLITKLIAAIGKNAAFPTASSPTAAAPVVPVNAFEANGYTPHPALFHAIRDTRLKNKFQGRPIVIGGSKAEMYFRTQSIVGLRDSGFDLATLIALTDVEFYFDEQIDTLLGANKVLLIEPNASCLQMFQQHDRAFGLVRTMEHKNTTFGLGELAFAQVAATNSQVPDSYFLPLDFRTFADMDAQDFPIDVAAFSMQYGVYTRPTSFLTTESGNILKDITGIYAFELTNAS